METSQKSIWGRPLGTKDEIEHFLNHLYDMLVDNETVIKTYDEMFEHIEIGKDKKEIYKDKVVLLDTDSELLENISERFGEIVNFIDEKEDTIESLDSQIDDLDCLVNDAEDRSDRILDDLCDDYIIQGSSLKSLDDEIKLKETLATLNLFPIHDNYGLLRDIYYNY